MATPVDINIVSSVGLILTESKVVVGAQVNLMDGKAGF